MTSGGEKRIPFHAYVQPSTICKIAPRHITTLSTFQQLPEEIQLHILAMCSASTLFQLMHTSLKLRIEASKLFWGNRNAYFLVEAQWLIDKAYPGESVWDLAFLANVQNVEVEYQPAISEKICQKQDDETLQIEYNLINIFWTSLKNRFPNVRKVILNHNEGSIRRQEDEEPFPLALQLLLRACPQGIKSSVLFFEKNQEPQPVAETARRRTATWQQYLSQRTENGEWYKSETDSFRKTIMMPPKQFNGPVGRFNELGYQCYKKLRLQHFGLWPLMVEALDRHHFDMGRNVPFACPLPSCAGYFSQAGEWTVHAANVHNKEWKRLLDVLPASTEGDNLRERSRVLSSKTREVHGKFQEIRNAWRRGNETTQREIKCSWMEQLNCDAAWETKDQGDMSRLWTDFVHFLVFDY